MSLFKSKEEKEAAKKEKMQKWLEIRGLESIHEDDFNQVKRIRDQLWGTYSGVLLDSKTEVPKDILKAILGLTEQNWLLIKQNEEIIELLKNK